MEKEKVNNAIDNFLENKTSRKISDTSNNSDR